MDGPIFLTWGLARAHLGGRRMFNPTISPHDPYTVLISCDMIGSCIPRDGGLESSDEIARNRAIISVGQPTTPGAWSAALW